MNTKEHELPKEWIQLAKQAMQSSITKEDFKKFLEEERKRRDQ